MPRWFCCETSCSWFYAISVVCLLLPGFIVLIFVFFLGFLHGFEFINSWREVLRVNWGKTQKCSSKKLLRWKTWITLTVYETIFHNQWLFSINQTLQPGLCHRMCHQCCRLAVIEDLPDVNILKNNWMKFGRNWRCSCNGWHAESNRQTLPGIARHFASGVAFVISLCNF